jgi:poly(A) polymerase Pap1
MAIVTPAFPAMNSSYNVTPATLREIEGPLHDASKICSMIDKGVSTWSDLFSNKNHAIFFNQFRHYLQICITSDGISSQLTWVAWCASKIRHLINSLEQPKNVRCRLLPVIFDECHISRIDCTKKTEDVVGSESKCKQFIYIGFEVIMFKKAKRLDLTSIWRDFVVLVKRWSGIKDDMDLAVMHIKSNRGGENQNLITNLHKTSIQSNRSSTSDTRSIGSEKRERKNTIHDNARNNRRKTSTTSSTSTKSATVTSTTRMSIRTK